MLYSGAETPETRLAAWNRNNLRGLTRRGMIWGPPLFLAGAFLAEAGKQAMSAYPHQTSLDRLLTPGHAIRQFGRSSQASIETYESIYGATLSEDYKQFLLQQNGLRYDVSGEPANHPVLNSEGQNVSVMLWDMNTFYGVGNGDPDTDLLLLTPRTIPDSQKFLPFCNWIGLGGDSCEWAEISQGKYKNWIFYTDGEIQLHYLKTDIKGRAVDDIVDFFIRDGFFMPTAKSFGELLDLYARYCDLTDR